jgi:hypothetical protein
MNRLKADATRIFASFARAFIAGIGVTQIADVQDMRGWTGVLTAAVVAGIAAALRTAETLLPASTPTPDGGS